MRERDPGRADRRLVKVALTERGRDVVAEGIAAQTKRDLAWLEVLDDEQLQSFHDLLHKISKQPDPTR